MARKHCNHWRSFGSLHVAAAIGSTLFRGVLPICLAHQAQREHRERSLLALVTKPRPDPLEEPVPSGPCWVASRFRGRGLLSYMPREYFGFCGG